jgi:spermidine synthase
MERVLAALNTRSSPIAALYASNTLGAVLGVLATAFWLVPSFGLARTAAACALLNLLCAGIALALAPRRLAAAAPALAAKPALTDDSAITGCCGHGAQYLAAARGHGLPGYRL